MGGVSATESGPTRRLNSDLSHSGSSSVALPETDCVTSSESRGLSPSHPPPLKWMEVSVSLLCLEGQSGAWEAEVRK